MIVVTGGAGFIGSNLVSGLNDSGNVDVIVVDDLEHGDKFRNIEAMKIADYIDKTDFLSRLEQLRDVDVILHQGACSDTMELDGRYMMKNNYEYSIDLLHYCQKKEIPFIYASSASVYGSGPTFKEDPRYEHALNVYAYSKLLFDRYVRRFMEANPGHSQIVGLRYFNVYGPHEEHKGRMASVAYHFKNQYLNEGHVRLFEGADGYANGEQRRDFVWVGDVIDVNQHFLANPQVSGIYNVGTGRAQTFNEMAVAVINKCADNDSSLDELVSNQVIRYIPFPDALKGKYQSFTQADLDALRTTGFDEAFKTVEQGIDIYLKKAN